MLALITEPVAQRAGIGLISHQGLAENEAGVGGPRVNAPTPLPSHLGDVLPIHHGKTQPEAALHLPLPLQHHRRRRNYHHPVHLLAQQQLAHDQPGFDRFAQAHVVGDEQAHPRHAQRLAQWLQLVGLHIDASPQGRLEQPRIGAGDTVPAQCVEVAAKHLRVVKAPLAHRVPGGLAQHLGIHLPLPEHLELLAVCVVVEAGHPHHRVTLRVLGRLHFLHQPAVAAAVHHTATGWAE